MSQKIFRDGLTYRQLQLSNTLRRLWIEHVLWTRFFIISTAFDLPDLPLLLKGFCRIQRILQKYFNPFMVRKGPCNLKSFLLNTCLLLLN